MTTITHSQPDIILSRWDKVNILEKQGSNLVNFLPGYTFYQPIPGQSFLKPGTYPIGSYNQIYSPIFDNSSDLNVEVQKIYDGITEFIKDINLKGQSVSRIDCWLEQSDDIDAIPHPSNDNKSSTDKYQSNKDYKNINWIFCDIFRTENSSKQTVFANRFERETNECKITKKYFTIRIESSWLSI